MTPTERCIQVAIAGLDEDFDRAVEGFEMELMSAPDLPEKMRAALMERFLADVYACRARHVARICEIFERTTPPVPDDAGMRH